MYVQVEFVQHKEALYAKESLGPGEGVPHGSPQQKEPFGGYDCEFVEPPPKDIEPECPICWMILCDPFQARCCGHNFCHTCIEQVRAEHKPCPTCREDNFEVFQNERLKHSLNQLHVWCTYSKDDCMWTGELGQLKDHLSEVVHSGEPLMKVDKLGWELVIPVLYVRGERGIIIWNQSSHVYTCMPYNIATMYINSVELPYILSAVVASIIPSFH